MERDSETFYVYAFQSGEWRLCDESVDDWCGRTMFATRIGQYKGVPVVLAHGDVVLAQRGKAQKPFV